MSRTHGRVAWLLGLFLAGALPAQEQQWTGEPLSPPRPLPSGAEFGSAVAVADDGTIVVGDYRNDVVYLFHKDAAGNCVRFIEMEPRDRGAWFGFSLAIYKNQLLVGAPKAGGTGAVYRVEVQNGCVVGGPRRVASLTPRPAPGDEVGSSVAIYGDEPRQTLAIGARGAAGRRGRVYFGPEGALHEVPVAGLAPNSELGQSVALNDTTLVMGAPSPYRSSGSPGAAYVVSVTNGVPGNPRSLSAPGGLEEEAAFGYAVAVAGPRILVGAPLANRNGVDSGAVFSFQLDENRDVRLDSITPGQARDQFGVAVALDAKTAVIGARYANGTRGAAYVERNGSVEPLQMSTLVEGAQFGIAVAVRGDTAVVGAFRQSPGGAAYRFDAPPDPVIDPPVTVELAADPIDVLESAGKVSLEVIINGGPAGGLRDPVTVDLRIEPGTATGSDYNLRKLRSYKFTQPGKYEVAEVKIEPDVLPEGPETFKVKLSPCPSGVTCGTIEHTVTIHESFLMVPAGPLQTSESGSAPLEVRLALKPTNQVVVRLNTSDPGEGLVSSDPLVFTPDNWHLAKTVQVLGQDDALCEDREEPRDYQILATTTSEDPRYNGLFLPIPAENADDELACLAALERTVCTDGGGTVVYTIALVNEASDVPAAPAELRGTLPSGVSVVTASADRGFATVDPVTNSVRWVGTVPPEGGGAATLTIVAALDGPPGPISENRAILTYDRDARGHQETIPITFEGVEILPCP